MKTNRRDFLKAAAGSAATAGVLTLAPSYAVASDEGEPFAKDAMVKFYDSTVCIGCQACVVA